MLHTQLITRFHLITMQRLHMCFVFITYVCWLQVGGIPKGEMSFYEQLLAADTWPKKGSQNITVVICKGHFYALESRLKATKMI